MRGLYRVATAVALGLLALAAPTIGQQASRPLPRDNTLCLTCHINFETEDIVAKHLAAKLTCAHCHGLSYDHANDEESAAKPDVLFGRTEVSPFCGKCHEQHKRPEVVAKALADWKGSRRPNGRLIRENAMCTDCHGDHRLPHAGPTRT
ncbi:MAG: hypothetical protein HZB16_08990 [Armatimonadetes bacterium]|nr:hypothetical protein [Armatimonadota bacterium]